MNNYIWLYLQYKVDVYCIIVHCIPEREDHFVQEMTFYHIFNIN